MFCRISPAAPLAVTVSAVLLPSGATTRVGGRRTRAAVLIPGGHAEVLRVLRHVLVGTADRPVRAALDGLEMRVEERPQVVGGGVGEVCAARAIAQDHGARRCVGGRSVICADVWCARSSLADDEQSATVTAATDACLL